MATEAGAAPAYRADKEALLRRLRRIEGQVRGAWRMVEEERDRADGRGQAAPPHG